MIENELPVIFVEDEDLTKFDWRKVDKEIDTDDDDDAPASENLIVLLGFDPDKEDWSEYTADAQIHAPKGGVTVKGKFFPGGQFIPNEGGYAKAYKKELKKEKPQEIEKVSKRSDARKGRKTVSIERIKHIKKQFVARSPEQNKDDVVTKLEKKTGLSYDRINLYIAYWAQTSADESPQSLGVQFVAKDIFKAGETSHLDESKARKDKTQEKFIKAIYDETQKWFKEQGFEPDDTVVLYRGVKEELTASKYALQPLSSFSLSKKVAEEFAWDDETALNGTVFRAEVPIKNIFSTPLTGIGCTNEEEVVVVGHDIDIHVIGNQNIRHIHSPSDFKKVGLSDNIIIGENIKSLKGCPEKTSEDFDCLKNHNLTSLKGGPKIVGGDFSCNNNNNLTSLEGAPKEVGGNFDCAYNINLTSLNGCPKEVGGNFDCSNNNLKSLEGCPKEVGGNFNCSFNKKLKSLKEAPKIVGGNFDCAFNKKLKSLEGCPKEVGGNFYYSGSFTEKDVRKVCNVKGRVINRQKEY